MERWSYKKPTKPGFYWVRREDENCKKICSDTIVSIFSSKDKLYVWEFGNRFEIELWIFGDSNTRWKKVE